jgi:hypothetical protein
VEQTAEVIGDRIENVTVFQTGRGKGGKGGEGGVSGPVRNWALHPQPSLRPTLPEGSLLQMAMICCCKPHRRRTHRTGPQRTGVLAGGE